MHEVCTTSFEIVIFDFASSIPEATRYLTELKNSGVKVIVCEHLWKIHKLPDRYYRSVDEMYGVYLIISCLLLRINGHIKAYMDKHSDSMYYAVTDCDLSFHGKQKLILLIIPFASL